MIALGLMLGDNRLRDLYCALDAIEHSRSAFEQYYGLAVAESMVTDLRPLEREWLRDAVVEASKVRKFSRDSDRGQLGETILSKLDRA